MTAPVPHWTPSQLDSALEEDRDFYVLDVRNRDEFEAGGIEGRRPVPQRNVPYFEMLESGGEDLESCVEAYVGRELQEELPRGRPVLAVCAKGGTSEVVARGLLRMGFDAHNLAGGMQAWGEHLEVRTVVEEDRVAIHQVSRPARGCLGYVVTGGSEAAAVDPGRGISAWAGTASASGKRMVSVVDTHAHADHLSGGVALALQSDCPYRLHPYDGVHPVDLVPARIDYEPLRDGEVISVGGVRVRAVWVPGHTLGNLALLVEGRWLLSGDSVFLASIARPDLGGKSEAWAELHYDSLVRLLDLPERTVVLPGHFSERKEADRRGVFAARLGDLRASNEGLRELERGKRGFVEYILDTLPEFPERYLEIKRVNVGLSSADEEAARELELGKNQCALAVAGA